MQKRPVTSTAPLRARAVRVGFGSCSSALVALVVLAGCSLDERTLNPIPSTTESGGTGGSAGAEGSETGSGDSTSGGGAGGVSTTNAQTATSSGGSDAGGASSAGGSGPGAGGSNSTESGPTTTGEGGGGSDTSCPDLDGNSVVDCDETLVANGSFDANLNDWHEEDNALGNWVEEDGLAHDDSGSATITNRTFYEDRDGQVMRGLWQCIPASAGARYQLLTQVRITGEAGQGWGGINVWFYDETDCTGANVTASTPLLGTTTGWSLTEAQVQASETAQSMLVRLVVNKPFSSPAITVDFDNVLIRED